MLDLLQKVFYTNNGAREAFVEMCESEYVQRCTFDSYLYKTVAAAPTRSQQRHVKLLFNRSARSSAARLSPSPTRSLTTRSRPRQRI